MAISIRESLRIEQADTRHFKVNGFPADCVNVAFRLERFPEFDLVVSGINHGVNMGDDIHYSGTVGAARHAAIAGIRAIAISSPVRDHKGDMRRAAGWLKTWLGQNFADLAPGVVYNTNYPTETAVASDAPYPRERITRHGKRIYHEVFEEAEKGADYSVLHLKDTMMGHVKEAGTDFDAFENGHISITPLSTSATHGEEYTRWIKKEQSRQTTKSPTEKS